MSDKREPYVGPRPFTKDEHELFFGRDHEADELVSLITAHPVVLLYAPSGAGKSSLLNAQVLPKLESEDEGFEVLGPLRVQGQIPGNFVVDKKTNIFVLNALLSNDSDKDPNRLSRMSFFDFLESRPPHLNKFNEPAPRVIVFDQFEELFTAYSDRWEQREGFFEQIREAIEGRANSPNKVPLRVVFAMREDYIAELDPYASILPEKLRARYRLEQLRPRSALSAITKPIEGTGRSYGNGVAEQLVENLRKVPGSGTDDPKFGPYVEPVQLQVVCQSIWQGLGSGETVITDKHLTHYGDVNRALSAFYERSIKSVSENTGVSEADLRSWFGDTLITPEGMRGPVYRGAKETEGMPNAAVDMLDKMQLIKSELKGSGARWYELAHDRFIEPVRKSNEIWLGQQDLDAQAKVRFENKADRWQEGDGVLLNPVELSEAKRLLKSHHSKNKNLQALIDASQAAVQRRRLKLMTAGVVVLAGIILTMGALTVYAVVQRKASEKASLEAAKERDLAQQERIKRVEDSTNAAELRQKEAEHAVMILEEERKKTEEQKLAAEDALKEAKDQRERVTRQLQIAQEQARLINKQQELLKEDSLLDPGKPIEITPETAPAFNKIKDDVSYATKFLNSLFGLNLNAPPVKPISEKERNAYSSNNAVYIPLSAQYFPDVTYHTTSILFIEKIIGMIPAVGDAGAIQVSYADIYASIIKQNKLNQTAQQADWIIGPGALAWLKGENVATSEDKRPLRSLKSPGTAYDDPVYGKDMQIAHKSDIKEGERFNGTYVLSGIPSHAFYETAMKIGTDKAGVIWTEALKEPDFRKDFTINNLVQITFRVAVRLHGLSSPESAAVREAWQAAGYAVAVP